MVNIDELKKQFKLSEEENERIFNECIKPLVFGNIQPSTNPVAVFAGGQSGSGKFSIMSSAVQENNNLAIITTDDYKPFHPQSEFLKKTYPVEYIPIIDQDAGIWTGKALKYAIDNNYSFVFEGTFKNTRVIERMRECKEKGFNVDVKVMATSSIESLLSIFERYEKEIECSGTGRLVSIEQHDVAYKNITNTVKEILNSGYCDSISIYGRGNTPFIPNLFFTSTSKENNFLEAVNYIENVRLISEGNAIPTITQRIESLEEKMSHRDINETEKMNFELLLSKLDPFLKSQSDLTEDEVILQKKITNMF